MRIFLLLPYLFSSILFAQNSVSDLKLKLANATSEQAKMDYALQISSKLARTNWPEAVHYIDLAEEQAFKSRSDKTVADFQKSVAQIYYSKDALDIALKYYLESYKYYEHQPVKDRYELENDLAIVYALTENAEKAMQFFHKLLEYEKERKNYHNVSAIYNNMGRVWQDKDLDSSISYFKKSLDLLSEEDKTSLKLSLYTNVGRNYFLKGESETAKMYYEKAMAAISDEAPKEEVAWMYSHLSEYYQKVNKIDSAVIFSEKAVAIFDSTLPFGFEQQKAVERLYAAYVANNDFKKAAPLFTKYKAIKDSLNAEDQKANVERLIVQEEYRKKEKMRDLVQSKVNLRIYIFILILFSGLLLLTILLFQYKNRIKRIDLQKQLAVSKEKETAINLELNNKKLIGKTINEMHKAEVTEEIIKDLNKLKLQADKKEVQSAIHLIVKKIKREDATNHLAEFDTIFEQIHEDFYKNLLSAHPDLTAREKRLSALLKLNLSTKEISLITGQTPKSVENARTRLRRKFNITHSSIDLGEYLTHF